MREPPKPPQVYHGALCVKEGATSSGTIVRISALHGAPVFHVDFGATGIEKCSTEEVQVLIKRGALQQRQIACHALNAQPQPCSGK